VLAVLNEYGIAYGIDDLIQVVFGIFQISSGGLFIYY
jgi:hypothetical protein